MTFELEYRSRLSRARGRCGCTVFEPAGSQPGVVILTEQADNPGPSITNAIEGIAAELETRLRAPLLEGFVLVEHYPANSIRGATFDLVTVRHDGHGWHGPTWRHLTEEQLDALVPGTDYRPADVLARWNPTQEVPA
jgi:hypothetical protein